MLPFLFFLKVIKHIWSTIIQVWKKNSSKKSLKVQIYYDVYACESNDAPTTNSHFYVSEDRACHRNHNIKIGNTRQV